MPGRIKILEPKLPNNIVHMVTSEAELRYIYFLLAFIPFLSALVGISLARGTDDWWAWAVRVLSICAYSFLLVSVAKSRFTLWRTKGDLFK